MTVPHGTGTIAVTSAASGIGAATARRLVADGYRVITVDRHDADITCDLGSDEGRRHAVEQVSKLARGALDGLVQPATVGGWPGLRGALVVSTNYFGAIAVLEGLRPALARSGDAAVVLGTTSAPTTSGWPVELEQLCLAGAEARARELADRIGAMQSSAGSEAAVARYVRRHALNAEWSGAGIQLNVIAPGFIALPLGADDLNDQKALQSLEYFRGTAQAIAARIAFLLGPEARSFWRSVFVDGHPDAPPRADDSLAGWNSPVPPRGAPARTVAQPMVRTSQKSL